MWENNARKEWKGADWRIHGLNIGDTKKSIFSESQLDFIKPCDLISCETRQETSTGKDNLNTMQSTDKKCGNRRTKRRGEGEGNWQTAFSFKKSRRNVFTQILKFDYLFERWQVR